MALINEFFSRYKTRIQKQVDVTSLDLMERTDWINPIAPLTIYDDFKLLVMRSEMIRTIARIIGEGGEIPSSHRGSFSVPEYVLAKHANSIIYTETDMKRMHEWDLSSAKLKLLVKQLYAQLQHRDDGEPSKILTLAM